MIKKYDPNIYDAMHTVRITLIFEEAEKVLECLENERRI